MEILSLTGIAAGIMANVICQISSARFMRLRSRLHSIYIGFLAGIAVTIGVSLGFGAADIAFNLIIYSIAGYVFFHFVNLGETGRRVRLLWEIYEAGSISEEELCARYDAAAIVDVRLHRLVNNGQAVFRNGRYYVDKPSILAMAKVITLLKTLVFGTGSEFGK